MLTELLSTADVFVATFSRPLKNCPWTKAVVSGQRTSGLWSLRIESFTDRQAFTAPWQEPVEDLDIALEHLLHESFRQILVQTPENDHHVIRTFKSDGVRVSVQQSFASRVHWDGVTADRTKQRLLTPEQDAAFLHIMDLATADGRIKAPMADKFRQVNHLLQRAANSEQRAANSEHRAANSEHRAANSEFVVVDAGCGKAYLSLSLVYVMQRMGRKVRLIGIDSNPNVIGHCRKVAADMGFTGAEFYVGGISEVGKGLALPHCDMLIALHACDTATDDALELGLALHADTMLVAPCCHHEVQKQLAKDRVPTWARPLLDDGITKERLGDLLTDTMRRDILRWKGYDAHLEEFISLEHTQKNVLLRATRRDGTSRADHWRDQVTMMIEAWGAQCALWPRVSTT
jgi:SAM-dependent methyltransferase